MNEHEWDIRIQCTVCGKRQRRHRADGNPPFGHEPPPTVMSVCYQCQSDAGYPEPEVKTLHFVDFASEYEMANYKEIP